MGDTFSQGTHHGAQKSTITRPACSTTCASKSASVSADTLGASVRA